METTKFNLEKAHEHFQTGPLKDHLDCKNYILKYFYPTEDGLHFVWNGSEFVVYSKETLRDVYLNRLDGSIQKWYFKENIKLYSITNDIHAPPVSGNKINLTGSLKHQGAKPYIEHSEKAKKGVEMLLQYLKEIWCADRTCDFQYIINWFANVLQGKKNVTAIVLKGPEGIGKSFFYEFFQMYVMGNALFLKAKPDVLTRNAFNKILCGKLLVVFEELPEFGSHDFNSVGGTLRDLITGFETTYVEKYEKGFTAPNISNFLIVSNDDSVPRSEGRRYFLADMSVKRRQDHIYYKHLSDNVKNDEVGSAFYAYLYEQDISNFHSERDMPLTDNKRRVINNRLHPVFKFLKEEYLLKSLDIPRILIKNFYEKFKEYSLNNQAKPCSYYDFNNKLKEVSINYYKSNSSNYYKISIDELQKTAEKYHWIHEEDEYVKTLVPIDNNAFEHDVETDEMRLDPLVVLQEENERLKKELREVKLLLEDSITLKLDKIYERDLLVTKQITDTAQSFNKLERIEPPTIKTSPKIIVCGKPKKRVSEHTQTILDLFD